MPSLSPREIDDAMVIFPARVVDELMPAWDDIPEQFRRGHADPWCRIASTWFAKGLNDDVAFYPRDGIDPRVAVRHVRAILASYQPKHQHKLAAVAFLLAEWFDRIDDWDPPSRTSTHLRSDLADDR